MKRLFIILTCLFAGSFLIAQENKQVPRYQGLAAGGGLFAQFPLGDYADLALLNLGASLTGEYTLPFDFGNNIDLGLAVRAEFAHVFPKAGTPLKSDEEFRAFGAFWTRFPFTLVNQFFAFQPEIGGGVSTFFTKYETANVEKNGTYLSPFISAALSFRWIPKTLQKLEVEAAPLFTIVPEQNKATMMFGLRLGAIWHFKMKNETRAEEEPVVEMAEPEPEPEIEMEQEPEVEVEPEVEEESETQSEDTEPEAEPEAEPEIETEPEVAEAEPEVEIESEVAESEPEVEETPEPEETEPEAEVEVVPETEESEPEVEQEPQPEPEEEPVPVPQKKLEPQLITERLKLKHILYFSKNGAVFTGLSRSQIRQNEKTIDEAVELIKRHPDCTVYIEGYAQNISGTEKEDRTACMPLSLWRAEYVRKELIKRGISADKIETVGMGGANPLAGPDERSNWWKNRRVEFLITYMSEVEDEK